MKKIILFILILVLCFYLFKIVSPRTKTQANTLQVTTSFYPLYFFASEIGGNKAHIYNITPSGAEPHDYEPTAQDIAKIENSNLLVLNGAHLESWADKIQGNVSNQNLHIIFTSNTLATNEMEEEGKKIQDPHVWLSPSLAKRQVENILNGFTKADPQNKNFYIQNAQNLEKKLDELDTAYQEGLKECKRKDFITSHAAFGYLAKTYGLKQIPIAGLSPEEEPSLKQLAEISNFSKKNNVKYIFFETLVSPKLAETVAEETGAKTLVLDPIEGVSKEDMKMGKNYFSIMNDNLTNLRLALQCK